MKEITAEWCRQRSKELQMEDYRADLDELEACIKECVENHKGEVSNLTVYSPMNRQALETLRERGFKVDVAHSHARGEDNVTIKISW
jgi:hypothetical protein